MAQGDVAALPDCRHVGMTKESLEESFNQPAKRAERVLAPGEGEAEPGEPNQRTSQPTKWATDNTYKKIARTQDFAEYSDSHLSPASQALGNCWPLPQARLRHRPGLPLSPPASQAR
jgi:hypothetical protein